MGCKVCEVLQRENEHLRKWIDRLMNEKVLESTPPDDETIIPSLEEPTDSLEESEQFGEK